VAVLTFRSNRPLLYARHHEPTDLFTYNWPAGTAGLAYIPLGIGFVGSAITAALTQDRIYRYLSERNRNDGIPEYRLVVTQVWRAILLFDRKHIF
jgi:DHA1 family multidrug resistance protein-like MFS transporter